MNVDALQRRLGGPEADMVIIFDGQCVFCTAYVRLLRLRSAVGQVALVDARSSRVAEVAARDLQLDLNAGMLVLYQGQAFHGRDAMNVLSLLTSPSGAMNRAIASIFRSRRLSFLLYPVLRLGRRATLLLLGRTPIRT